MKIAIVTADNREPFKQYDAPAPWFGTAPEALLQGMAQLPDLEVHVVSCIRQPVKSPEKLAPNIFFHSLHVPKIGWMRTFYQGCIRAARKKLRALQPDIVHGQGTEHDNSLDAIFSGFPNVITIHGNMRLISKINHAKPFSFEWLSARLEAFTIPRSRGVVCITRYTQQAVSDLARRTWVVPNAVDGSFFDVNSEPPPDKPPQILCVGNVTPRKNPNAFIRALDPLAQKHKFELLFLGLVPDGQYGDEFKELVRSHPWCRYEGFADREKLKRYLRDAVLIGLPSLEDNCPMAVLEGMAAGVPVVAAKVGGVPDLVEEGRTGFFCDPLDAASMRQAVEDALVDRAKIRAMAHLAKQQAQARFHPKVVAQRHVEIYREVLSSPS